MFGFRKIFGTIFMVVAFLVLATLATFIYNTDQASPENTTNNIVSNVANSELVQKSQVAIGSFLAGQETSSAENLPSNNTTSKKFIDAVAKIKWQNLFAKKATSTNEGENENNIEKVNDISSSTITKYFNYQKTESGAEVIFRAESGREYKLPLPFKFLTKF